jgi:hypothetical protein
MMIGPQTHGLGPCDFLQKNNFSVINIPATFAFGPLSFFQINHRSMILQTYEDFQDQVYKDSDLLFSEQ